MRQSGDEAKLLRAVLDRIGVALEFYSLEMTFTVDTEDNSYTASVSDRDLDLSGVLTRLRRYGELESILANILSAGDEVGREQAMQRGRCFLNDRALRTVE